MFASLSLSAFSFIAVVAGVGVFVRQVTDGMSFIESKGYIHANLRASSVLLFADDNVKISGFSVSRRSNDLNACRVRDG